MVLAEHEALGRMFRNLTVNALRYGVAAPAIEQRGSAISFSNRVADPDTIDTDRLFERFYQGDEARADEGGGLGLAIVSQLARAVKASCHAVLEDDRLTIVIEFERASLPSHYR